MHCSNVSVLALPLTLLLCFPAPVAGMVQVGQVAPEFVLTDVNGLTHRLSDYSGKVVVLAFVGYG